MDDDTVRIMADLETATPDQLVGYVQTATAIRSRISDEMYWRLIRTIASRLTVKLWVGLPKPPTPTETRP